jgi:RNA polymerase sigma-70 factor (ECF subfamily)
MNREEAAEFVDALYEAWYLPLLRYACRLVNQRASAEEIVQDTFLDLYRCLRAGQTIRFPKAWSMCVVRRKAIDVGMEPFGCERLRESLEAAEISGEWAPAIEMAIDCERVRAHMDLLSVREQEVLLLRLESMKYREIAASLGISINAVNTLLARALYKLHKAFSSGRVPSANEEAL